MICRTVKQEPSYDSMIPSFETVSDDVKAFEGINYRNVYKDRTPNGSAVSHDRAAIFSRRLFWKVFSWRSLLCSAIKKK